MIDWLIDGVLPNLECIIVLLLTQLKNTNEQKGVGGKFTLMVVMEKVHSNYSAKETVLKSLEAIEQIFHLETI